MVVNDFDVFGTIVGPAKAQSPLIVDSYAVLSGTISPERFETIAWRHAQVVESAGLIQLLELAACNRLDVDESANAVPVEQGLGVRALERLDHVRILTRHVSIGNHRRLDGGVSRILRDQ